jgi:hypothetical protein
MFTQSPQKLTKPEIENRLKVIGYDLNNVPERLLDPLTLDFPLENPVFCNDGRTYNLTSYILIKSKEGKSAVNDQALEKVK